jgi:hypothetical protein
VGDFVDGLVVEDQVGGDLAFPGQAGSQGTKGFDQAGIRRDLRECGGRRVLLGHRLRVQGSRRWGKGGKGQGFLADENRGAAGSQFQGGILVAGGCHVALVEEGVDEFQEVALCSVFQACIDRVLVEAEAQDLLIAGALEDLADPGAAEAAVEAGNAGKDL